MDTMDKILFGGEMTAVLAETDKQYQFAELYRAATNAFLQGEAPSVDADEWEGSTLSLSDPQDIRSQEPWR